MLLGLTNIADNLAERVTNPKYYFIDDGILSILGLDLRTSLLENLIAVDLLRRYGNDDNVYFYNHNIEVDFYIPMEELAIQVSYSINGDADTFKRETTALVKIKNQIAVKRFVIITYNEQDSLLIDDIKIEVIPAYKWLLNGSI